MRVGITVKPYWSSDGLMVYQGNALDVLKELPANEKKQGWR